jgi:uncharacterized protein YggU (UPF0235/DUF167 family)
VSAKLKVHVHPGAKRERVKGWRDDGSLGLDVTAAPERGRANRAVERLLAGALGIAPVASWWRTAKRAVEVGRGGGDERGGGATPARGDAGERGGEAMAVS